MMDRNEYKEKKSAKNNIGFYIALTICIVTIAAAAWTTYGSVVDYNQQTAEETSSPSSEVKVNNDVSGQKYESSAAESSLLEESSEISDDISQEESVTVLESSIEVSEESSFAPVQESSTEKSPVQPVEKGTIIKIFSPNNPIKSNTTSDWRTHQGIDISAKIGAAVHAVRDGTVKSIYKDPMLGNVICIEHTGGYTAYYCGLTETTIAKEGNTVSAGDTIGYIGIVPFEVLDESHLHLEVKKDGEYIDPTNLF